MNIKSETRAECDKLLLAEILKNLDALPEGTRVMLKLSLPIVPGTFDPLVSHPKVLRVVALSGGYKRPEACAELARLLAQLGDTERSNQLFQEGLGLLDNRLLSSPLPVPARV